MDGLITQSGLINVWKANSRDDLKTGFLRNKFLKIYKSQTDYK